MFRIVLECEMCRSWEPSRKSISAGSALPEGETDSPERSAQPTGCVDRGQRRGFASRHTRPSFFDRFSQQPETRSSTSSQPRGEAEPDRYRDLSTPPVAKPRTLYIA